MDNLDNISEELVIDRAIKGEEIALRYLLEKYQAFAFTIALRIVKNREDAEEVVQDGFIKAFKMLRSFKGSGKFSTWLYRIIYNTALTTIRGHKIFLDSIDDSFNENMSTIKQYQEGFVNLKNEDQKNYLQMAIAEHLLAKYLYHNHWMAIGEPDPSNP